MPIGRRAIYSKMRNFLELPLPKKLNVLQMVFCRLKGILNYRRVFGNFGSGSVLYKPMMLGNPQFMHIGKNVTICRSQSPAKHRTT